jgi:hypothetical protein
MLFGSTILEVAVGLLFVYLVVSLLCSAIGEYIEAKYNNRARYLRRGIELLLNETSGNGDDLAQELYDHGLVRPFYRDARRLPSYIPSRTFTLALWNMATAAGAGNSAGAGVSPNLSEVRQTIVAKVRNKELKTAILTMLDEAQGDTDKARRNIEEWYDGMMDRVSGWYKRYTSVMMLLLGFVVAAILNIDTVNIANALAHDSALRSAIVGAAERRMAAPLPAVEENTNPDQEAADRLASEALRRAYADVSTIGLPIGWVRVVDSNASRRVPSPPGLLAELDAALASLVPPSTNREDRRRAPDTAGGWILKIIGIVLTGFAVSQGAPFWFDILNKFMVIRSTVKPAEKSQTQPSKDKPAPQSPPERSAENHDDHGKG